MKYEKALQRSREYAQDGDVDRAIETIEAFFKGKDEASRLSTYDRATLYLGHFFRVRGEYEQGLELLHAVADADGAGEKVRVLALCEAAVIYRLTLRFDEAEAVLRRAEIRLEGRMTPGEDPDQDKVLINFLAARGQLYQYTGRHEEALADFRQKLEVIIGRHATADSSHEFITTYMNLYNCHMVLGNRDKALKYLTLAHARLQSLERPYAYGLLTFFENLAIHNLFAAGSQDEAISALAHISESVVKNFADFRKVFDFFSSIIVQLHEGRVDLEVIRDGIREYGADPLIKTYLPVLLGHAAPPGGGEDGNAPAATLE